jgi:hypothetical protein
MILAVISSEHQSFLELIPALKGLKILFNADDNGSATDTLSDRIAVYDVMI